MNGWDESDRSFMQEALAEARAALAEDEVPVGAVVVVSGRVVARGHNRSVADRDPTAHAEVVALRAAATALGNHRLPEATLYASLEPCAMCVGAMMQARIARVVFAAYDEKAGAFGSAIDLGVAPGFNHRLEINGGLFAADAAKLLEEFFADKRRQGQPG